MYQTDFILRQIEMIASFLGMVLFGKRLREGDWAEFELRTEQDAFGVLLWELLKENRLNEAENLLFAELDKRKASATGEPPEDSLLEITLTFYRKLAAFPPERLAEAGFSLSEVREGLRGAARRLGVSEDFLRS